MQQTAQTKQHLKKHYANAQQTTITLPQ